MLQDQQLEIHEQLMQHMGGGTAGSPSDAAIAADYNADGASAEDEYNPDVRTTLASDFTQPSSWPSHTISGTCHHHLYTLLLSVLLLDGVTLLTR